jgi:hypothetical protein
MLTNLADGPNSSHATVGDLPADDAVDQSCGYYWTAFVAPWLDGLTPNTAYVHQRRLSRWLRWCLVLNLDPVQADTVTIDLYVQWYRETQFDSKPAITAIRSALSSWRRWLAQQGHRTRDSLNPCHSCLVDACDRPHYAYGYCSMHYKRFKAHGDATVVKTRPTVPERTCTVCGQAGPRAEFWGDRSIHKRCRAAFEAGVHAAKAAAGVTKLCPECKQPKPLSEFTRNQARCKTCTKDHKRQQQVARRARSEPIRCRGSCGELLAPTWYDPGFVTCRRCRFDADPNKYREQWRRRRVRKLGAPGRHTTKEWEALKNRYGGLCAYCATAPGTTRDHVIPLVKGGSDYAANILPACETCNSSKHDAFLAEWRYRQDANGVRRNAPALRRLIHARPECSPETRLSAHDAR